MEDQQADKAEHQRIFDAKPECDTRQRVGEWLGFVVKCGERGHEKTRTAVPAPAVIRIDFLRHTGPSLPMNMRKEAIRFEFLR